MIIAVCDKCKKEVTMKYTEQGLEELPGWCVRLQYFPLNRDYAYRLLCPDCKHVTRKVEE